MGAEVQGHPTGAQPHEESRKGRASNSMDTLVQKTESPFTAESLKVDVPDEKFAITAFIAGLGIQSKDLMFSISKNPQASMAEVLVKAEKYINGEEALTFKRGSSSTHEEKSRTDKQREQSPRRQRDRERSPRRDRERSPKRRGSVKDHLGRPQPELRQ